MVDDGIGRRAQIDTETVKGLLLMNGGGAIALLAFLPAVIDDHADLARWVVAGILVFLLGAFCAIVHNHLRRRCSMAYQKGGPVIGRWGLGEPAVCLWSWGMMYASALCFLAAGVVVCVGALRAL